MTEILSVKKIEMNVIENVDIDAKDIRVGYILNAEIKEDFTIGKIEFKLVTTKHINNEYTVYGLYNKRPLFIHNNIRTLLANGYELKQINHTEIRDSTTTYFSPFSPMIITERKQYWFYKGIILIKDELVYTDALVGLYDTDTLGSICNRCEYKHISDEITFTVNARRKKKNKRRYLIKED